LDQERGQRELIRLKPSNRPNQQLELLSLYKKNKKKAIDRDHSIRQYEHDTKVNPYIPLSKRNKNYVTLFYQNSEDSIMIMGT